MLVIHFAVVDEKPYRCPLCNYMGKSRGRVRNHLFKFHKMKKVQQEIVYMPDQQTIEINNLEDTEVIQQITHVTANGNIELDTIDLDSKSVDLVMKGLYKQRNDTQVEDSEFDDPPGKLESSDQPTRVIVKDEHTSGENAAQLIVDNDGILTAIQDSKNLIILQHDGLQYGAIEVVDSQI
ncbi:hypothetical protein KUTeg_009774 [Tegillarca granosa]|uniref:C2H2-type domain-containing protein n=1 Tax=Tegillarca granosa TaxID=220873 RepID=A0ABQ9F855_TEGGR|nr:hypothetical protein KUTeg_009774 [Tegillarca granosa]